MILKRSQRKSWLLFISIACLALVPQVVLSGGVTEKKSTERSVSDKAHVATLVEVLGAANAVGHTHPLISPSVACGAGIGPSSSIDEPVQAGEWDETKWQVRNARETRLDHNDPEIRISNEIWDDVRQRIMSVNWFNIRYIKKFGKTDYELKYDQHDLSVERTFRESSDEEPAFQVQYAMLKRLAQDIKKPVEIRSISRHQIINVATQAALIRDFPELDTKSRSKGERLEDFRNMSFFTSPNGRNTLDLIKKMNPTRDPFSLIRKVTIQYEWQSAGFGHGVGEYFPNVRIELTEPSIVSPATAAGGAGAR